MTALLTFSDLFIVPSSELLSQFNIDKWTRFSSLLRSLVLVNSVRRGEEHVDGGGVIGDLLLSLNVTLCFFSAL